MQGCVDSQESLTGEDRPELSETTKEVTKRNNTDHILDRPINWQYLLPTIKLFYNLCTISTPFGKFKYNRLPMDLECSPDFVQEVMENIFRDVAEVEVCIDDIGIFSDSWDQHLALLCIVLQKLQENGFIINP